MKTKTIAISIPLFVLTGVLFAQNKHDTVPMPTRTDTIHKSDSASTDTSKAIAFVIHPGKPDVIAKNATEFLDKNRIDAKENEITISPK